LGNPQGFPNHVWKISNGHKLFEYCTSDTILDKVDLDISVVSSINGMFTGCSNLTYMKSFSTASYGYSDGISGFITTFSGCSSLTVIGAN
jgi:hypothetical protein